MGISIDSMLVVTLSRRFNGAWERYKGVNTKLYYEIDIREQI